MMDPSCSQVCTYPYFFFSIIFIYVFVFSPPLRTANTDTRTGNGGSERSAARHSFTPCGPKAQQKAGEINTAETRKDGKGQHTLKW